MRGRAVCFASGEPAGLPGALAELRRVVGADTPILLGFDRGGSYPVTFSHCRDAGVDWVSYRRGPLAATGAAPAPVAVVRGGTTRTLSLADETVELAGYGRARQLTVYEHGTPALQILTSLTTTSPAELVVLLRARWRIENTYKYLAQHYGIDWLCDYRADITPNTAPVDNPARIRGRAARRAAEADLAAAERALAQLLASPAPVSEINKAVPAAQQKIATASSARLEDATRSLAAVPAKLPANQVDPTAERARPQLPRRGLQMVLRLLAHNAENLAGHPPGRLPQRPRRTPRPHPSPAAPGRLDPLHPAGRHRHPRPARQPPPRPRPAPAPRRTQHHPRPPPGRPTAPHLPAHRP